MRETETTVVFKILGILARADGDHSLVLNAIADVAKLDERHVQRVMDVLEEAGAVRSEQLNSRSSAYCLTPYGRNRLGARAARFTTSA